MKIKNFHYNNFNYSRKSPKRKIILYLLIFVLVLIISFVFWIYKILSFRTDTDIIYEIPKGNTINQTITDLAQKHIIPSSLFLKLYLKLRKWDTFLAGKHKIPANSNIIEIARYLVYGKVINNEITITILEGWNKYEIARYLNNRNLGEYKTILEFIDHPPREFINNYDFLKKNNIKSLEGFLYPDTYQVFKDKGIIHIFKKMLDNYQKKVYVKIQKDIKENKYSLYEIMTLASIVEKEANTKKDRRMIADVFLKRLEIGMPLQSDATVNYVTGKSLLQPTYKDVSIKNNYNTYYNQGIPPAPISNPSFQSIDAVLHPLKNPYYYFLTTPEGRMIYSRTGEEHLKNKRKYLN